MTEEPSLLDVQDLHVSYGPARALSGVALSVRSREILAVLGSNGAGKTTLARALSGLVPAASGSIRFDGQEIARWSPDRISRAGLMYLPEGRGIFPGLTVHDNLKMACSTLPRDTRAEALERAFGMFSILKERHRQRAGALSGGEQQMLSLGRAFAVSPRLIIADELSLGLAPKMVELIFEKLREAAESGITVVVIEQFVHRALALADSCAIVRRGQIAWSGPSKDAQQEVLDHYIGETPVATA